MIPGGKDCGWWAKWAREVREWQVSEIYRLSYDFCTCSSCKTLRAERSHLYMLRLLNSLCMVEATLKLFHGHLSRFWSDSFRSLTLCSALDCSESRGRAHFVWQNTQSSSRRRQHLKIRDRGPSLGRTSLNRALASPPAEWWKRLSKVVRFRQQCSPSERDLHRRENRPTNIHHTLCKIKVEIVQFDDKFLICMNWTQK